MWIFYAFASALFAGITSILAKCGIKKTNSTVATAYRTVVVLFMSFLMVLMVGSLPMIQSIDSKSWLFLGWSGLATGASWLCYFKALQLGNINKVVPIDKSSTILTILFAFIFLHETISIVGLFCVVLMTIGTFMMIDQKDVQESTTSNSWLIYAVLSAVFAALTSILGKVGIENVESNLGTMIRTCVVLIMAFGMVFVSRKKEELKRVDAKELGFIILSGIATGGSWLCYYKALQSGPASVVVPIDKLSVLVTILFSYVVFHEKLTKKSSIGLFLIVVGTLGMLI